MDYQLWHGDCLEEMDRIEAGSVDAIICDPPYGTTACKWDVIIPFEPLWKQYKRVIKKAGAVVLFGSEPFSSLLRTSNLEWYRYDWVWIKEKPVNIFFKDIQPLKYHENISVFSQFGSHNMSTNKMAYFPQMEKRKSENKRNNNPRVNRNNGVFGNRVFINSKSTGNNDLIFPKSYQFYTTDRTTKLHPTQKPVALLEYLIKTYTNEGDLILDNTCGSGSTLEAAMRYNRRSIGIEKDAGYFNVASQRLARVAAELRGELNHLPMFAEVAAV